jgi:predicted ATP-dependent serine protease
VAHAQADGSVALAVAAAYLSHLWGRQLPDNIGFFAQIDDSGSMLGRRVTDRTLTAAKMAGITTIVLYDKQVS